MDFSAIVTPPVYAVLHTLGIVTVAPASFLFILLTSTWRHLGAFAGNAAVNFRFLVNGIPVAGFGGVTDNNVRSQIGNVSRNGRIAVVAGLQTVVVEISKFGAVGNSVNILPVTNPDLDHSALLLQEQL